MSAQKVCLKCKGRVPALSKVCPKCSEPFEDLLGENLKKKRSGRGRNKGSATNLVMGAVAATCIGATAFLAGWGVMASDLFKEETVGDKIARIEANIETIKRSNYGERLRQYGRLVRLAPDNRNYISLFAFYERKLLDTMEASEAAEFLEGLGSFDYEAARAVGKLNCRNESTKKTKKKSNFSCVVDRFETIKWTVESGATKNTTGSIKLSWDDYNKGMGDVPAHAGKPEAHETLQKLISLYAPDNPSEIEGAFWGETDREMSAKNYDIKYSFNSQGVIDQRLIEVVTSRN